MEPDDLLPIVVSIAEMLEDVYETLADLEARVKELEG